MLLPLFSKWGGANFCINHMIIMVGFCKTQEITVAWQFSLGTVGTDREFHECGYNEGWIKSGLAQGKWTEVSFPHSKCLDLDVKLICRKHGEGRKTIFVQDTWNPWSQDVVMATNLVSFVMECPYINSYQWLLIRKSQCNLQVEVTCLYGTPAANDGVFLSFACECSRGCQPMSNKILK